MANPNMDKVDISREAMETYMLVQAAKGIAAALPLWEVPRPPCGMSNVCGPNLRRDKRTDRYVCMGGGFSQPQRCFVALIEMGMALIHTMVAAELACGTPPAPHTQTPNDIDPLSPCDHANLTDVRDFIEREWLYGLGYDLMEIMLLAPVLLTADASLRTFAKRLED